MTKLRIDITGQRFGKLVAVEHIPGSREKLATWRCVCDCGNETFVHPYNLKKGATKSCGCGRSQPAHNRVDIIGHVFGRLTVVESAGLTKAKQTFWVCRCECGGEARTTTTKLRSGHTQSCGCYNREVTAGKTRKDGFFVGGERHPLFDAYHHMVRRCTVETDPDYAGYGGRGIAVCDRWLHGEGGKTGFALFVKDMGPRPSKRHSLDREDNDGNYEPGNVRWATAKTQARNRRSNRTIECDGEVIAISEYCERKGIRFDLVNSRLSKGWSVQRAVSEKSRGRALA